MPIRRGRVAVADGLEPRRLLSGTLQISGTAAADTIVLDVNSAGAIVVNLNGKTSTYDPTLYTAMTVDSGSGADVLTVNATALPTTLSSSGPATVTIGSATAGMSAINGTVTVNGGLQATHLVLDDSADTAARTVTIGPTPAIYDRAQGLSPQWVEFSDRFLADLTIKTPGVGGTSLTLLDAFQPTTLEIHGGPSSFGHIPNDQINIGGGRMFDIGAPLTIHGGGAVTLDDSLDTTRRTVNIGDAPAAGAPTPPVAVTGLSPGDVDLSTSCRINLPLGGGNVNLKSLRHSLALHGTAPASAGGDVIHIGDNGSLAKIVSQLSIAGAAGAENVTLDDSADPTQRNVIIGPDSQSPGSVLIQGISTTSPAGVAPESLGALTIDGGPAGNRFSVDAASMVNGDVTLNTGAGADGTSIISAAAGRKITVNGNGGNDIVQIGSQPGGLLQRVLGDVIVTNQGGGTAMSVFDADDTTGRTFTLDTDGAATAGALSTNFSGTIHFRSPDITGLTLNGGTGGNTFDVRGTPAAAPGASIPDLQITGGSGNDTLNVSGLAPAGRLAYFAGGGTDNLSLDFQPARIGAGSTVNFFGSPASTVAIQGAARDDAFTLTTQRVMHGTFTLNLGSSLAASLNVSTGTFMPLSFGTFAPLKADGPQTQVELSAGQYVGSLSLTGGAVGFAFSGAALNLPSPSVGALQIDDQSTFDIGTSAVRITSTALTDIRRWLARGYAGGTWTGTGIISTAADSAHGIGYNSSSPVTLALTPYGDANLDHRVNFDDLLRLAQNYGGITGTATWDEGDFNYDGNIGFDDLLKLAQNYGLAAAAATPRPAADSRLP